MRTLRTYLWTYLCVLVAVAPATLAADDVDFSRYVQPFLERHCYDCHGLKTQNAQLRYDSLKEFRAHDSHLWTLVHKQLSIGEMPPEDRPQPSAEAKRRILSWIERRQRELGPSGARRLNRRELSAALRDLTGLAVDFTWGLPDDGKVDGFDTGAEGLQDAADSVTQIMQVTRRAVEGLRFLEPASATTLVAQLRDAKDGRAAFDPWKSAGVSTNTGDTFGQPGTGLFIKPKWLGERGGLTIRVPPPTGGRLGVLRLQAVVSAVKPMEGVPNPRLCVEIGGRELAFPEISNTPDQPRTLSYEVSLDDLAIDAKGIGITLCNRVEMPYGVKGFENDDKRKPGEEIPGGTGLFRPLYDHKAKSPQEQPIPFVVLHSLEIEPDYKAAWPAFGEPLRDSDDCAQRVLGMWMERAWRRPVAETEQVRFRELYKKLRGTGLSFDAALRATFQAVLLSGSFRYLPSPRDPGAAGAQHVLASRLSFMLWGTPPDSELRVWPQRASSSNPQCSMLRWSGCLPTGAARASCDRL